MICWRTIRLFYGTTLFYNSNDRQIGKKVIIKLIIVSSVKNKKQI